MKKFEKNVEGSHTGFSAGTLRRMNSENCPALIPPSLSRTFIAETVVFIGCPGVPRIVRIDSVSVRAREMPLPGPRATAPVSGENGSRGATDPRTGEESPTTPASRLVAGQGRRRFDGERRGGQMEEKQRFFSPIPAEFRRIYFEAGISVAVTSARNSGPRSRKAASLRGFGNS